MACDQRRQNRQTPACRSCRRTAARERNFLMKHAFEARMDKQELAAPDYAAVSARVRQLVPARNFTDRDNLISLGLDSLKIMRLVGAWRKEGLKVSFSELIASPRLADWVEILRGKKAPAGSGDGAASRAPDGDLSPAPVPDVRFDEPFPLTDVQYAYWVGRRDGQPLGGTGCHAYIELDGRDVDPDKLTRAWKTVLSHHPMLRALFLEYGQQRILPQPGSADLPVHDLRAHDGEAVALFLEKQRARLSHRRFSVEKGQLAGLELCLLPEGRTRICFDIDLLVADVQSFSIILRDLAALYVRGATPPAPKDWLFSAYLSRKRDAERKSGEEDAAWWQKRLDELPGPPLLPLAREPAKIEKAAYRRRTHVLRADSWQALKARAARHGLTPAMVLLTIYAETLDIFSTTSRFLINVPLFDRKTGEKGLEDVVADFTDVLLIDVDLSAEKTFFERACDIRDRFHANAAHSSFSGVRIQRELARRRANEPFMAPVVFACNLGTPLLTQEFRDNLGRVGYMLSQTPQVWIDFQMYETEDDALLLAWDTPEELFPEGLVDRMFSTCARLVEDAADRERMTMENVQPLYEDLRTNPCREIVAGGLCPPLRDDRKVNMLREEAWNAPLVETGAEHPYSRGKTVPRVDGHADQYLHVPFFARAAENPEAIALLDCRSGRITRYGELARDALRVAACLTEKGIRPGMPVGVTLPRGVEQVAAVLGILACGGHYVPASSDLPRPRYGYILARAGIAVVLTNGEIKKSLRPPENVELCDITESAACEALPAPLPGREKDLAYVIFTSGSTGEPKGVAIEHAAAWNTVHSLLSLYGLQKTDRGLAVSALDFDLSVFDIFGFLSAGASLALVPDEARRDAARWAEWVRHYGVTVWNSVPVLLDMLLSANDGENRFPLRLAFLSGDWIGLDLPERLRRAAPQCRFIAMGGATEASIWSNHYEVACPLPAEWKSIPYGFPLPGQAYRIVDRKGRDCPVWVEGELWIGGAGTARGYVGDPEKSAQQFVQWQGSRWYRTGDMGRYWPDGCMEFLGRRDFQVKVRGHRIELGEIETALRAHPAVREAVVTAGDDDRGGKHLCAYIVPEAAATPDAAAGSDPDAEPTRSVRAALHSLPAAAPPAKESGEDPAFRTAWRLLEDLYEQALCMAFRALDVFTHAGETRAPDDLIRVFGVLPRYERWLGRALRHLAAKGHLRREGAAFLCEQPLPVFPLEERAQRVKTHARAVQGFSEEDLELFVLFPAANLPDLLRGKIRSHEIYMNEGIPSVYRKLFNSVYVQALDLVRSVMEARPLRGQYRILELGAGLGTLTGRILPGLPAEGVSYLFTDVSRWFLDAAREKFKAHSFLEHAIFDINEHPQSQGLEAHSFDLILAASVLHAGRDPQLSLDYAKTMLAPGGVLLLVEETRFHPVFDLNMGLQQGWDAFPEDALRKEHPLLSGGQWEHLLRESGFAETVVCPPPDPVAGFLGFTVIAARGPQQVVSLRQETLEAFLAERLPDHMIPRTCLTMARLPLNENGKVNRKALPPLKFQSAPEREAILPETPLERDLAAIWSTVLPAERIGIHDDFFQLGGDSLLATQILALIRKRLHRELPLEELFRNPTIAGLEKYFLSLAPSAPGEEEESGGFSRIVPCPDSRFAPFPLTDIQHAYWIGRIGAYELGNVASHIFFEFDNAGLDLERLGEAFRTLVRRHDMLRVRFLPDATQQVQESVPPYDLRIVDLRGENEEDARAAMAGIRREMSFQVLPAEAWPLFDIRAARYRAGREERMRMFLDFDALIADAWSLFLLVDEWFALYRDPDLALPELELGFRDYVLAEQEIRSSERYGRDRDYWLARMADLPPAPELPLAVRPSSIANPRTEHYCAVFEPQKLLRLKERAAEGGVTVSTALIAAYAEILATWSAKKRFTLNLTFFNRLPLHPQVNAVVGDFSSLVPLAVDAAAQGPFLEKARSIQRQLWQDMGHRLFSGVQLLREMNRGRGQAGNVSFPVVFTGAIGLKNAGGDASAMSRFGKLVTCLTQTPQVWLDCQAYEQDGALLLNLDAVEGLFPEGLVRDMFAALSDLTGRLADDPATWESLSPVSLPAFQRQARTVYNATDGPITERTLSDLFCRQVEKNPDNLAVIAPDASLTFKQVYKRAGTLARTLSSMGAQAEDRVGVLMKKGWEQVVAVAGIHLAGAAYVPLDADSPPARLRKIIEEAGIRLLVAREEVAKKAVFPEGVPVLTVSDADGAGVRADVRKNGWDAPAPARAKPDDLAYIIYTSGSTGQPKGVAIEHRGAVNTVLDMNARFGLTEKDRILGLSALSFDLSVYDIWGALSSGAALVLPDADKLLDPSHWLELLDKHKVTLWNSAPMFMQMLMEYLEGKGHSGPRFLRLVLLSGDWIPLALPGAIRAACPEALVVSLGGATEASVWSILHPVGKVEAHWKSIPYGKPMLNQRMYVLDQLLFPCPDWVVGDLYIGGVGLAREYWGDPKRTAESFILHPATGERLYRTGDLGRHLPDGNIEFLGRNDHQVKLRGYRIELGEIESVLMRFPEVREAAVVVQGDTAAEKRLIAFAVTRNPAFEPETALAFLREHLPDYMTPARIHVLEKLPLSDNGKVDRKALLQKAADAAPRKKREAPASSGPEKTVNLVWEQVLGKTVSDIDDNFFDLGGTSVLAVRLHRQLARTFSREFPLVSVFTYPTVRAQAAFLANGEQTEETGSRLSGNAERIARRRKRHGKQGIKVK
jgi:yersiniabactin nonribosomal peptide synthetase